MSRLNALSPTSTSRGQTSRLWMVIVFMIGTIAGAGLLGARWAVRGNADPFDVAWPLYLQSGSLVLTLLLGSISRRPLTASFGLYFGLVLYMLVDGRAEYPVASIIALTVHGLLPALTGALCLVLIGRIAVISRNRGQH